MTFKFAGRSYSLKPWTTDRGRVGNSVAIYIKPLPPDYPPDSIPAFCHGGGHEVYEVAGEILPQFLAAHGEAILIMHRAAPQLRDLWPRYDFDHLIQADRLIDIAIEYRLLELAKKGAVPARYDLGEMVEALLGVGLDRHRRAIGPAADPVAAFRIFEEIHPEVTRRSPKRLLSHRIQLMGEIALDRVQRNGIGVDLEKRKKFLSRLEQRLQLHKGNLARNGYDPDAEDAGHHLKRKLTSLGVDLPAASAGRFHWSADRLAPYRGKHPFVDTLLRHRKAKTMLRFALPFDKPRIPTTFETIGSTGRVSSRNPSLHNVPKVAALREIFVPEQGHTFLMADYEQLELCALAQVCLDLFGQSRMQELINQGVDLHRWFASIVTGKPVKAVEKRSQERQAAKACNFGFPGGLGIQAFLSYAKKNYGLRDLGLEDARKLKKQWLTAFPEMERYLRINRLAEEIKGISRETVKLRTGRIRAFATYCEARNTRFQGLAADGAKIALYNLTLAGYRVVNFIHDEVVIEMPTEESHEKRAAIEKIMISSMQKVIPDVRLGVEIRAGGYWM